MVKVYFKFDKEKDLWNQWNKSNWKSTWSDFQVDPNIKEMCNGKTLEGCKGELSKYLERVYNSGIIPISISSLEKAWEIIEKQFFERMDSIMKNKFTEDIYAYLTTCGICPYDPKEPSFMFSLFGSIPRQLNVCGHEIMHLYFHKFYWDKVESQIGNKKTKDLKEALTVLLNLEFIDFFFVEDKGYEAHKKLREFIVERWKQEKDFDKLLEKCVEYLIETKRV